MSSKSIKDTDSPASTFFLPQLRSSRRGSSASLASTTQLDKENLSQALDQIHSTASQSDTLTTFNEYTSPPSSSSGPDSKGIAGELQGGLSGLYTRIRASVGNVKDIVNLGGEDAVGETTSVRSPKGAIHSPTPSTKSGSEPSRVAISSAANLPRALVPGSEQHSPVGTKSKDPFPSSHSGTSRPSKNLLGSVAAPTKSGPESVGALKTQPTSLTQAVQSTPISPALAEVNISAVKQLGPSDQHFSATKNIGSAVIENGDRFAPTKKPQNDSLVVWEAKVSVAEAHANGKPDTVSPSQQISGSYERGGESDLVIHDKPIGGGGPERSYIQVSEGTVQPFPSIGTGENDEAAVASSSDGDDDNTGPPRSVTTNGNPKDDVFQAPNNQVSNVATSETVKKGIYQHLEIPLRKGVAPPVITRSHSPNSALSTTSSSETNADSIVSSPLQRLSRPAATIHNELSHKESSTAHPAGSKAELNRDLKTMNVFSQVKNKVLDKEYWMKDENARDCFYCGDPFSTFRRKHHCSKSSFL